MLYPANRQSNSTKVNVATPLARTDVNWKPIANSLSNATVFLSADG